MKSEKNKIIELENGLSFIILEHAVYKNENYFFVAVMDGEDVTDEVTYLHEINENGELSYELVQDEKLLTKLVEYTIPTED